MAIQLNVNGYFKLTICLVGTEIPVENETEQGVLDNLQQGEYIIGIRDKEIADINDLLTPLYSFVIESTDSSEYDFDEL